MIHRIWKTFVFAALLVIYVIFASLGRLLIRNPHDQKLFLLHFLSRMCRVLLAVMGIKITVEGRENIRAGENYFVVANHLSYLDPLLLSALTPMAFVTSVEMRDAFFLGTFTKLAGSFFVERRSRSNIRGEVGEVENALKQGFPVGVFPEATSTDGSKILPFKRPLFAAAILGGKPVLPIVIQYEKIDGRKVTRASHQILCWYGDMPFFSHSLRLLSYNRIRIRLSVLPEIPVAADSDRDTIAQTAYQAIQSHYQPIV
ncbi:MAG: lysophospholipid acyltransferase family protein [Bacteriovoracia bacterium]